MRHLADDLAMRVVAQLGAIALRATVLLVLALVFAALLKPAAARHRVWSGTIVGLLLLPLAVVLCGPLALPILPGSAQAPAGLASGLVVGRPSAPLAPPAR